METVAADAPDSAVMVTASTAITQLAIELPANDSSSNSNSSPTVSQTPTKKATPSPSTSSIVSLKVNTFMKFIKNSVGQWSIMDATLGLKYYIANNNEKEELDMAKFIEEASRFDPTKEIDMARILKWAEMMTQIDNKPRDKFLAATNIQDEDLVVYDVIATHERTGYCILLDHKEKTVMLSLRGTHNTNDILLDLQAVSIPFSVCAQDGQIVCEGHAHKGMYLAAKWFEENIVHTLEELLQQNPEYSLVITGHSLGGGVGAILTMLIRPKFPGVRCIAIAPPSCVDATVSDASHDYITALILADDVVPRTSTVSMRELRVQVEQYNWQEEFHRDLQSNKWTANISHYLERKGWILPRSSSQQEQDGSLNTENSEPVISSDSNPDLPSSSPTPLSASDAPNSATDLASDANASANTAPAPAPAPAPTNSSSSASARTPMSILSNLSGFFSGDSESESGYDFLRKKLSSGSRDNMDIEMNGENEPQQSNSDATTNLESPTQPEFSTIRLHPPGRLLHMRRFGKDGHVYIKDAHYKEFETIRLVPTCISDHRMANYFHTLLDLSEQDVQLECVSVTETRHHFHPYIHQSEDDLEEWQVIQTSESKIHSTQRRVLVALDQEQIRADVMHYLQDEEGGEGVFNPFISLKQQSNLPKRPRSNSNSDVKSPWWDD